MARTTTNAQHRAPDMLRERNEQIDMLETLLPFHIADVSPELQAVSDFLDDHPHILSKFTAAMIKRSANSKTHGRPTESAEAVFRMLLLRRMQAPTFRMTHDMVNDSLALRQLTPFRSDFFSSGIKTNKIEE